MIETIRYNTFETNSSSCHSLTVLVTKEDIDAFNSGELWYCMIDGNNDKCFWTTTEIVENLWKTINTSNFKEMSIKNYIYLKFSESKNPFDGIWNISNKTEEEQKDIVEDFECFKDYIANELSIDMFNWAFSKSKERKYFSKYLIKAFIRYWIEYSWYSPLLKITDIVSNPFPDIEIQLHGENYEWYKGDFKLKDNILIPFNEKFEDNKKYTFAINLRE